MFFSKPIPLVDFFKDVFDTTKDYRLNFDTRDNSVSYIDIELVKVPDFSKYPYYTTEFFISMMEERTWTWLLNGRFKYLYVYLINGKIYLCDRDNVKISNFQAEYQRLELQAERSDNLSHNFKWFRKKYAEDKEVAPESSEEI
ncbi:hypothetical protein N9948_00665 [bacterium]|nr:hypothetical protein [bacterium]